MSKLDYTKLAPSERSSAILSAYQREDRIEVERLHATASDLQHFAIVDVLCLMAMNEKIVLLHHALAFSAMLLLANQKAMDTEAMTLLLHYSQRCVRRRNAFIQFADDMGADGKAIVETTPELDYFYELFDQKMELVAGEIAASEIDEPHLQWLHSEFAALVSDRTIPKPVPSV